MKTLDNPITYVPPTFPPEEMLRRATEYFAYADKRRSVREFSDREVSDDLLDLAIQTASTAPSGAHKQPWFFAVVRDPDIKHKIRLAAEHEETLNYQQRFPQDWKDDLAIFGTDEVKEYIDIAPAIIVVFKENYRFVDGRREKNYYVNESVGIAAGMLIAALHHAGLQTLTHTPNPMAFLNEILERPKNEVPVLLMPVGYAKEGTQVPDLTRKPIEAIRKVY
ncbi:nitroreductase family protein [Acanthopleuribacter pedis]|uniref:Nitroreductase family protein n=1 Tax=Acanthopleuribacter pedis TaxID=442870 RepID=A0A8J7QIJ9_9BACT|nr:nitroreductase family protein [Acanthopleuribacter pedis]MBO1323040.1 nitroreductase family protein [Acanthopleuribacter pedis]